MHDLEAYKQALIRISTDGFEVLASAYCTKPCERHCERPESTFYCAAHNQILPKLENLLLHLSVQVSSNMFAESDLKVYAQ